MLVIPYVAKFSEIIKIYDFRTNVSHYWIINYYLDSDKILIKGKPVKSTGESAGYFSFTLNKIENKENREFNSCSSDELRKCHLEVFVLDIFTSFRGRYLGSFIFMEFLKLLETTIHFSGKATIYGKLGARNETTSENIRRRENFWKSFGIDIDYKNNTIIGNLKVVLEHRKYIWNIEKIPLEKLIK